MGILIEQGRMEVQNQNIQNAGRSLETRRGLDTDKQKEVKEGVEWARKKTVPLYEGGKVREDLYKKLLTSSYAVVGDDLAGRKTFAVESPQLSSAKNFADFSRAQGIHRKVWERKLRSAVQHGLLSFEEADKIREEYNPSLRFQPNPKAESRRSNDSSPAQNNTFTLDAGMLPAAAVISPFIKKEAAKRAILVVAGVAMLLESCNPVPTVSPDIQTPTAVVPGATETPVYTTPDGINTGAEFPKTIDQIGWADPYDSLHKQMKADVLADTVKSYITTDYGKNQSDSVQFLEVAGGKRSGGMIPVFRDEDGKTDWTMWTVKADGTYDYVGRPGTQLGYSPLYWTTDGVGFVVGPSGRTDIFKSVDGKVTQFKPLGQGNWISFNESSRGKVLASMAPIASEMIGQLTAGGRVDWKAGVFYSADGKVSFIKNTQTGVWEKFMEPKPTEAPMTVAEVESLYVGTAPREDGNGTFDIKTIFDKTQKKIYTAADYEAIANLRAGTPITIVERHRFTSFSDPIDAANAARDRGAVVIVSLGVPTPDLMSKLSLAVANNQYDNGDRNVRVVFGEVRGHMDSQSGISMDIDIWLKDPGVVPMPKHFIVENDSGAYTLEEAGLTDLTDDNWARKVKEAGFKTVIILAQPYNRNP